MDKNIFEYEKAINLFWKIRNESGVTSNHHLDPLAKYLAEYSSIAGVKYFFDKTNTSLRGRYRPSKNWDIVFKKDEDVLAAVELKSMSGSFGNNLNNRTEEAIGNAVDIRAEYKNKAPWLGYVFVIEENEKSSAISKKRKVSYVQQVEDLCNRMVEDGLYDAAVLIKTKNDRVISWSEPRGLDHKNFVSLLSSHLADRM